MDGWGGGWGGGEGEGRSIAPPCSKLQKKLNGSPELNLGNPFVQTSANRRDVLCLFDLPYEKQV